MNGLRTATLCIVGLYLTAISSTVAPSIGEESPITTKGTQTSLTNSVDMKMVLLKPGDVWLGIPDKNDDSKRFYWSRKVWISEPFYLANTEVTQEQYRLVMGEAPCKFKDNPRHQSRTFPIWMRSNSARNSAGWRVACIDCQRIPNGSTPVAPAH